MKMQDQMEQGNALALPARSGTVVLLDMSLGFDNDSP